MRSHLKKLFLVYFFFTLTSLIVLFVYYTVKGFEYKEIIKKNNEETLKRKIAIEEYLVENLSVLKLIQAYVQNNQSIKRVEFSKIVSPVIESNKSVQAIEWIPKVLLSERKNYESVAIKDGFSHFFFKEFDSNGYVISAKPREFYYPVYFLEPLTPNEIALGFDISTFIFAQRGFNLAIQKFGIAFCTGLRLIHDSSDYSLLTCLPVYSYSKLDVDKKEIIGFVAGDYKFSTLINHVLSRFTKDYAVLIYDKTDAVNNTLLYSFIPSIFNSILQNELSGSSTRSSEFLNSFDINVANFSCELIFISSPHKQFWVLSSTIFVMGELLVVFLTILIFMSKKKSIEIALFNQQLMQELKKRMQYEKELKLSEERFSKLFFSAPLPITYIRLLDRTIFDVNDAFEKMLGYSKSSLLGKTTKEIGLWVNSNDWNNFHKIFLNSKEVKYMEVDVKTIEGDVRTCLISGNLIQLQEQDFIYTFFQDITKRKKTEMKLQSSELKYREIFNSVNDAFFIYDIENETIVDANKKASELYKYSLEELKGIDLMELVLKEAPSAYQEFKRMAINSLKSNNSGLTECQMKDKDGKIFWVEISFKEAIIDERRSILSMFRDISERKRMEKLLVENEFLFRTQFNNSNLGIVIASAEKQFIRANKRYCDTIGYTEEEILGKIWADFTFPEDYDNEIYQFNRVLSGEIDGYDIDKRFIKKDGELAFTHISVSCFRNPDKSIHYFIAYIFDITDRVEMENKILKAIIETEEIERTRFAQELHDGLGPLLSSIKMYSQWMLKPGANLDQMDALLQIENLADMANQSVREIAFGLSPHMLRDFGITEALHSFIDKIKLDKSLTIEFHSNLFQRFDETTETIIYRVLIECINNSLKHSQADFIKVDLNETPQYIDIECEDNGIGFDWNEIGDKRRGMGLYNIQNRLKSIDGKLLIFSQHGKGTVIKINILI